MRHKFVNFTRGSQLIGHFGFMFAAGLKGTGSKDIEGVERIAALMRAADAVCRSVRYLS